MDAKALKEFVLWKNNTEKKMDFSKKGSIDKPIQHLIEFINKQDCFYTTSSCSGRIIIVSSPNSQQPQKQNLKWLLNSHDLVDPVEVIKLLQDAQTAFKLKYEPFILHVKCKNMENSRLMQNSAFSSGFKNSGLTFGHKGRQMMFSVRATSSLEVPLTGQDGGRLTSDEYIQHVVTLANEKMRDNFAKILRFENNLKTLLKKSKEMKVKSKTDNYFDDIVILPNESGNQNEKVKKVSQKTKQKSSLVGDYDDCLDFCQTMFSTDEV